jgi:hypothetical protein
VDRIELTTGHAPYQSAVEPYVVDPPAAIFRQHGITRIWRKVAGARRSGLAPLAFRIHVVTSPRRTVHPVEGVVVIPRCKEDLRHIAVGVVAIDVGTVRIVRPYGQMTLGEDLPVAAMPFLMRSRTIARFD